MSFLNIMFCYYFSLEEFLQGVATPPKNKSMEKFRGHRSMDQHESSQKGKCKVYCFKLQRYLAIIYLFKVINRNTRKTCEICSKLIVKTPEGRH